MQTDRPWIAHYDPGVPAHIDYPRQPLFRFLEESARKYPDRACTILNGSAVSYGEMNEITERVASALATMGVKKGDRVGLCMPNTPQFVMAFYGILKVGGVVVATNPLSMPAEIAHQADDSGIRIMFVDPAFHAKVKETQAGTAIERLIVTSPTDRLPRTNQQSGISATLAKGDVLLQDLLGKYSGGKRPRINVGAEDTALFQYSGGTTGVSKAAVASHGGVVANTIQFRSWLVGLEEGKETVLLAIPLFHAYGMIAGMSLGVALGASLALVTNPRDLAQLLETITQQHPTIFPGVPNLYSAINNHPEVAAGAVDLRSIRVCISGSTSLPRSTKERFEQLSGGKICEGYGLSEAPVVTHCNPLHGINKIGSIGMPMPDVECKVVNPANAEIETGPSESGELILRGPQVMTRYHNMPAETATALRQLGDGKVWLFTGDIVRMDEDGYFYIVDRKKEVMKPGGYQVWPREVEEAIAANPKVLDVGVAGIPDARRGEVIMAWIVLRAGVEATAAEMRDWCREHLSAYKVPTHFEFRTELPKTTVGKTLRRELVRQYKESHGGNG